MKDKPETFIKYLLGIGVFLTFLYILNYGDLFKKEMDAALDFMSGKKGFERLDLTSEASFINSLYAQREAICEDIMSEFNEGAKDLGYQGFWGMPQHGQKITYYTFREGFITGFKMRKPDLASERALKTLGKTLDSCMLSDFLPELE